MRCEEKYNAKEDSKDGRYNRFVNMYAYFQASFFYVFLIIIYDYKKRRDYRLFKVKYRN